MKETKVIIAAGLFVGGCIIATSGLIRRHTDKMFHKEQMARLKKVQEIQEAIDVKKAFMEAFDIEPKEDERLIS